MKPLLAALAFLVATPAMAEPLPQGNFVLGTYIWPDTQLYRVTVLSVDGSDMTLGFYSLYPLDPDACNTKNDCFYFTEAATAQANLDEGKINLTEIKIDLDASIEPYMDLNDETPSDVDAYTSPLMEMLQGANLAHTPDGFTLETGLTSLSFYRAKGDTWKIPVLVPDFYMLPLIQTKACEVRAILPLFTETNPSASQKIFTNALKGLRIIKDLRDEAYAAVPPPPYFPQRKNSKADKTRAVRLNVLSHIPNILATSSKKDAEALDEFWEKSASKPYDGNRSAFDADMARYGDTLADTVTFLRYFLEYIATKQITVEDMCSDPSLGFIK